MKDVTIFCLLQGKSMTGDCLCIVNNSYLVDIDKRDINKII